MPGDRETSSRPVSISPPPKRRRVANDKRDGSPGAEKSQQPQEWFQVAYKSRRSDFSEGNVKATRILEASNPRVVPSPVQLNFVKQLPPASNTDTISIGSVLGDVMIKECWLFNYLFDLDFIMSQFDPDIKAMVKVHIVHGSWRKEDTNKISIDEAAKRYPNVDVVTAYMPEAFGTHHSKMMILFRHDDLAQVIILTGNFIQRDWCMSQAIWRSPLLPLLDTNTAIFSTAAPIGSGSRFKHDLTAYLKGYGTRLQDLTATLSEYDFRAIKAALVASTPGKQNLRSTDPGTETLWGWPGLKHILSNIPSQKYRLNCSEEKTAFENSSQDKNAHIVIQVSSVASVGEKWLSTTLFPALAAIKISSKEISHNSAVTSDKPRYSIVFPTADTIRKSVNGYGSGASIHMKTQSPAQAKQLSDIRPMLCHWASNTMPASDRAHIGGMCEAGRGRAAPHIKTYIRFHDASMKQIDWAMVTSANLSTQAWGSAASASGEVRICSYEIGVVFWPTLWSEGSDEASEARMVPVFGYDTPSLGDFDTNEEPQEDKSVLLPGCDASEDDEKDRGQGEERRNEETLVGWRMPYDLPLVPYSRDDMPWCTTEPCNVRDWMGKTWPGHRK